MKFKIVFTFVTLILAGVMGQVIKLIAGDNLQLLSAVLSASFVSLFVGYLWGKGELIPIIKNEPLPLACAIGVYAYFFNAIAPIVMLFGPALIASYFLCQKFIRY